MKPDICIYHGNCADGFTAAWAVWKRFGEDVEYVPGVYGEAPPDVTGKNVVIVDFSYKKNVLLGMAEYANSILVLDHHRTAEQDLADFCGLVPFGSSPREEWERRMYGDTSAAKVQAIFDMNRSGAGITWDFLHQTEHRPALVDYVEDRDLWRFKKPESRAVNAFIFAHEYTFDNWDMLATRLETKLDLVVSGGQAIEKKHHKDVAELVSKLRREMVLGGHWVPVANMPYTLTSDAGHLMCKPYASPNRHGEMVTPPFAACYWDTPEGRVFSLRSDDQQGAEDVSEIAKSYGGGGHKNAAGFTMPIGWEGDNA